MNELPDPKILIAEELKKKDPDWRLIERLSRDEVDADPVSVRFSVDASHIQRLGFELVAKQETALVELIKNSYDADATQVIVNFSNHDRPDGTLVIEDNGVGMTSDVVRDAWMRISTINKREHPFSQRYGRLRAGRKGIGRFAVQRLGKRLTMETEVSGQSRGLRVIFNWDDEFQPGLPLYEVFSQIEEYEKPPEREQTRLLIFGLREAWSETAMQRVWKAVLLLQPPFKISRRSSHPESEISEPDPGFEVVINGLSSRQRRVELSIEKSFLDHAIADISGEILPDGSAYARVRSDKLGIDEKQNCDDKFLLTEALSFSAKYFIYTSDALSGLSLATATEMARAYAGIRIYRNGFRVLPYGEPADDWLRLDLDTARRHLINPANNRNLFGQVELDGKLNALFEETSSREGLIENEAFEELRSFVRSSVEWAIKRVAAIRERKTTAGQKDFISKTRLRKPTEVLGGLLDSIGAAQITNSGPSGAGIDTSQVFSLPPMTQAAVTSARAELEQWEKEVEERQAASLKYEEMLRILASLGLSISVFGHEIKSIRGSVAAYLSVMDEKITDIADDDSTTNLTKVVEGLKSTTSRMFDLGGYIAGLMSSTESRELRTISLKGAIERFVEQFRQYMERQKIQFEASILPEHLRTTEMHSSELDSVLLNFLTNSIKSMKKARAFPRRVRIFAREDGDYALIGFEDNGSGVPPEIEEHIFDAFFTTTMGTDDDGVAGPGTGLGLKIVSDIAQSYGGYVCLGTPSNGFNCCFEFRVRSFQIHGR